MSVPQLDAGKILNSIRDAVIVANGEGRIMLWNPAAEEIFGYSSDEAQEMKLEAVVPEHLREQHRKGLARYRESGHGRLIDAHTLLDLPAVRKDGEEIKIEMALSPAGEGPDREWLALAVIRDVSDRKALEDQLKHQAYHDPLTDLPNRKMFQENLERAIARASRNEEPLGLLFLDLDNFKEINDSMGHDAGDELLVEIGRRVQDCVRQSDLVARLGGDEFTVLLESVSQADAAARVAERIEEKLRGPFVIDGNEVSIQASIGISFRAFLQSTAEEFLSEADSAMYWAKEKGKARYEIVDDGQAV